MHLVMDEVRPKDVPSPKAKCDTISGKRVPKMGDRLGEREAKETKESPLVFQSREVKFKFPQHSLTIQCIYSQMQWSK